ncbi:UDP-glucose 4-epimerase GalE [Microbacterium bovistercoris]|uniref:UDP-glucose 4-epimerase n=1 Tax=Microbacterium bovistercoris TaxID=2293570 RepID=A0A371NY37_9MICO|nr:UDP-glucose 4-epimerase GalE [Microbacterium bovistercoris]REJ08088.1 UDP-glucose 4-epimerase GalE [Microbacterium bovistercoris]
MRILLTGGAGYIGSHVALVLLEAGHDVLLLDDFSNSSREAIDRVQDLTSRTIDVIECDLADRAAADAALKKEHFDAAIHFAGLKAVGESVAKPSEYYRTNLNSTLNLLDIMREKDVRKLVFSSSATVYGTPAEGVERLDETQPVGQGITNPYGWTKAFNEQIIRDVHVAWPELEAVLLRYFNPVGAHPSGRIGEDPSGIPNNLMPFVAQVAVGRRDHLSVFGDQYPTHDGTGVRDYIHVMDLAEGHMAALEHLKAGVETYNLGSGEGQSVLDVVKAFGDAAGREIPYQVVAPRPGDLPTTIADPTKANRELDWHTTRSLAEACRDTWNWQSQNPNGFAGA